jgi:tetratricopeptide (TPR) repeat protein
MGEFNQILWTLDNETQPHDFERLCTDLLGREGYHHIRPSGGTKDHGRDAEIRYWKGASEQGSVLAFQFSLEKNWERKLSTDAAKIAKHCPETVGMVFVTSQKVTGTRKDQLKTEFKSRQGWQVTIYDREWLRHRLGEFHQDLAKKYFGVELPPTVCYAARQIELSGYDEDSANEIFQHTSPELVRASILESTRKEPSEIGNWNRLARTEYLLRNYDGALEAITKALQIEPQDKVLNLNLRLLKGAILAEKGIRDHLRPLLVQSRAIYFEAVDTLKRAQDHYNFANVLAALGEIEEAESHYSRSIQLNPTDPRAWKNFGSLLLETGKRVSGMKCFERALQLNPNLVEAHLSKATALLIFFANAVEAIACFESAYRTAPDLDRQWKYVRYWYSTALWLTGQYEQALRQIEIAIALRPGDSYLLNRKASVLSELREKNQAYEDEALEFFKFRAHAIPNDYPGLAELIEIYKRRGHPEEAWPLICSNLASEPLSLHDIAKKSGMSIVDFQVGFQHARLYRKFRQQFSVKDHFITLHGYGLRPEGKMLRALNYSLIVPFGIAAQQMANASSTKSLDKLQGIWAVSLETISRLLPVFGSLWLAKAKPPECDEQTRLLSVGIIYLLDIVVAETARQFGFLAAHHRISVEEIQNAQGSDWRTLRVKVGISLFEQVAVEWKMTKPN